MSAGLSEDAVALRLEMTHEGADDHIAQLERTYTSHAELRGEVPGQVRTIVVIEPDRVTHHGG